MWTPENRHRYDRSTLRYPSDLTDMEWSLVAPLIPPAKRGGNKRTVNVREIVNGLSCPRAWCSSDAPRRFGSPGQTATAGRLTRSVSPTAASVSRVM